MPLGSTLMSLLVKLGVDSGELTKGLTDAEKKSEALAKNVGKNLGQIGSSMTKVGGVMSLAITAPIVAIGKSSIDAASNLSESMNKVNVVFGESAAMIQKWSEKSATSFGLSRLEALDAAGAFGAMFKSMGLGNKNMTDMSTGLVQIAADMGSFYNIDPSEMLEKLRSGMVGQSEPLLKFGVVINEANVKAKALEMGLGGVTGKLTDQEKVLARYALIVEQSSVAQGDFERTSGGLANSQRIMNKEWENTKAALGTHLLPLALKLTQAFTGLLTSFNNLSPGAQKTIIVIGGILAVAGPLLLIAGQIMMAISALGPIFAGLSSAAGAVGPILGGIASVLSGPVLVAVAGLALQIGLLYVAWKNNFFWIQDTVKLVTENIKSVFAAFIMILKGDWEGAGLELRAIWDRTWAEIQRRFEAIKAAFPGIAKVLGSSIISGIINGIKSGVGSLVTAVKNAALSALNAAKALLGIKSPSSVFAGIGHQMMAGMAQGIRGGVVQPVGALAYVTPQMIGAASGEVNVNMNNTINNDVDVEMMAYRIARIIERRKR